MTVSKCGLVAQIKTPKAEAVSVGEKVNGRFG
jgi:hypothetical protein